MFQRALLFLLLAICFCSVTRSTAQPSHGLKFFVGKCRSSEYYSKAEKCSRAFFKNVRVNLTKAPNCGELYEELKRCMVVAFDSCIKGSILGGIIGPFNRLRIHNNFLLFFGDEELWCQNGGLDIPEYIYDGTNCNPLYAHITRDCVSTYQYAFNSNSSLWRLCREYSEAKMCLHRSILYHCSFDTRALSQMIELMVERETNFQPYCPKRYNKGIYNLTSLLADHVCPPRAHADVVFLVDTSGETTRPEFESMLTLVNRVTHRMQFGISGIRVALAQFHERTQMSIKLNRYPNARVFRRGIRHVNRIFTNPKHRRYIGKALTYLSDKVFDREGDDVVIRPFHTPVIVVLSTGESADKINTPLESLRNRNVHVIRLGPNLLNSVTLHNVTINVRNTTDFPKHTNRILSELCRAERSYQDEVVTRAEFATPPSEFGPSDTPLSLFNRFFTGQSHLPLLWSPKELMAKSFMFPSNQQQGIGTQYNFPGSAYEFVEGDYDDYY